MRQKSGSAKLSSERIVRIIRRATRKQYSAEEKIRIVLDGLRGEHSIAELCRREGVAESLGGWYSSAAIQLRRCFWSSPARRLPLQASGYTCSLSSLECRSSRRL